MTVPTAMQLAATGLAARTIQMARTLAQEAAYCYAALISSLGYAVLNPGMKQKIPVMDAETAVLNLTTLLISKGVEKFEIDIENTAEISYTVYRVRDQGSPLPSP